MLRVRVKLLRILVGGVRLEFVAISFLPGRARGQKREPNFNKRKPDPCANPCATGQNCKRFGASVES